MSTAKAYPGSSTATVSGTVAVSSLAANAGVNIGSVKMIPPSSGLEGTKNVTTAGTRVALASSQALERGVNITAKVDNTGIIYVGFAAVSSTVFMYALYPGDQGFVEIDDPAKVFLDCSVNGEGVSYGGT